MDIAAEGGGGLGGCGGADRLGEERRARVRWVWAKGVLLRLWRGDPGARVAEDRTPPRAQFLYPLWKEGFLPLPSRRRSAPANGDPARCRKAGPGVWGGGALGPSSSPIFSNSDWAPSRYFFAGVGFSGAFLMMAGALLTPGC